MKTLVGKTNKTVSILTMFAFLVLATIPALGTTEFEVGTQFGGSIGFEEEIDISLGIPGPSQLYATWFPNRNFAISPEFSIARISTSVAYEDFWGESQTETRSLTVLNLGGRAAYFLRNHTVSSPYILGKLSFFFTSGLNSERGLILGGGLGYQWRIGPAFVLQTEAQYQHARLLDNDENSNGLSLIIRIGTRFGNNKTGTSEMPNTQ